MFPNLFCVRLYYACYLCCLGIALSAVIFILFRYSVCCDTHWDHGPLLTKKSPLHSSMCWQMQSIKQCFLCTCCWCSEHGHTEQTHPRDAALWGCRADPVLLMQPCWCSRSACEQQIFELPLHFHYQILASSWETQLEVFVTAGRASPSRRMFTKFPMPESFFNSR